jgi:hypothetical protein
MDHDLQLKILEMRRMFGKGIGKNLVTKLSPNIVHLIQKLNFGRIYVKNRSQSKNCIVKGCT